MGIKSLQRNWDEFGRNDPLWAILTREDRRGGQWDIEEFFATGRADVAELMENVATLGIPTARAAALDFGCGAGRLTQALADHFEHVTGVDIAPSMIELARRYNNKGERCSFVVNPSDDLRVFVDETFDLIYTHHTLQHMAPRFMLGYLDEFVRTLKPGGVMAFHIPSDAPHTTRGAVLRAVPERVHEWIGVVRRALGKQPRMQMYWIPPDEVRAHLAAAGARIVLERPVPGEGSGWDGIQYFATRP
jgi:SAM-dependent methyltransferase